MYRPCEIPRVRRGISRKDDTLPARVLTQRRPDLPYEDNLPPLGEMLSEYYEAKGWSEEGIPTKETLTELGLEELAEYGYGGKNWAEMVRAWR